MNIEQILKLKVQVKADAVQGQPCQFAVLSIADNMDECTEVRTIQPVDEFSDPKTVELYNIRVTGYILPEDPDQVISECKDVYISGRADFQAPQEAFNRAVLACQRTKLHTLVNAHSLPVVLLVPEFVYRNKDGEQIIKTYSVEPASGK